MVATMDLQLSPSEIPLRTRARAFAHDVAHPSVAAIGRANRYPCAE
jgi:hypothetical protein